MLYYKNNTAYNKKLITKLYKAYNLYNLGNLKAFLRIRIIHD